MRVENTNPLPSCQSVINVVSQNDALLQLHNPHYSILLRAFTITTCLLVLMSLLCYAFRTVDAVQRSTRSMLAPTPCSLRA